MPITADEYHVQLRSLLHDTGEGYSNAETFYNEDEVVRISLECRKKVLQACVEEGKHLTVNLMIKYATATTGANVPSDFWRVIVGTKATSRLWVNSEPMHIAEALVAQGADLIYVKAGKFYGTAANAYYWAFPTSEMQPSINQFADFPDSFYHCVMTLTSYELVFKESSDVAPRLSALRELFAKQFASLQ